MWAAIKVATLLAYHITKEHKSDSEEPQQEYPPSNKIAKCCII